MPEPVRLPGLDWSRNVMPITHEIDKLAYLDALGLELLVAIRPLPGAAPSAPRSAVHEPVVVAGAGAGAVKPVPVQPESQMPRIDTHKAPAVPAAPGQPVPAAPAAAKVREPAFHMAAVVVGGCLWLDTLQAPTLPPAQLKLIQAIAYAVSGRHDQPRVTHFDWPLHGNHLLDLGPGAAAAALTSFVQRQLQQHQCRGLVLLGQGSAEHLQGAELPGVVTVAVPMGTAELLAQPLRKREAWQALEALCGD
ncbi:MAG TPA: hypothetical protein VIC02_09265 [Kineobactrum sp.]